MNQSSDSEYRILKCKSRFMDRIPLRRLFLLLIGLISIGISSCSFFESDKLQLRKGAHIILIGNNLGSRMANYGLFETELQVRYPDSNLYIRNLCDAGNTPGFRPHSGMPSPWAFPAAEKFYAGTELANDSHTKGFFETPDQWISRHKADIIIAFFGLNESYRGAAGLKNYKAELDAFVKHTLSQKYNGTTAPQLALISPTAFEDLSQVRDLPNGKTENENLELYADAMEEVAKDNNIIFIDLFSKTKEWFKEATTPLTIDGLQLNENGYAKLAPTLATGLFGQSPAVAEAHWELVHAAVQEKNWMWHNDYKMPNGVHVFGERYEPYGPDNFPKEIIKVRELTAIRDTAIWLAAKGKKMDLKAADQNTTKLPEIKTNYTNNGKNGSPRYLYGEEAIHKFKMAPGYKIELFASEQEFPDLEKPVQLTFDSRGRLWVAVMPTYPQWKPGDPKPNDKLIILEDTNNDGKADKQTIFADGLQLPLGFELSAEGVYVSQGTNLILLTDTNGDDKADKREILLSGFDDHDTHHAHHAYTYDPSGGIYMGQGIFLLSDIETAYGTVRATGGGFYRYNPKRRKLDFIAQLNVPNPWGITFDEWGEDFYAETSSPTVSWMLPGSVKPEYAKFIQRPKNLIEDKHKVRPTSGLEIISSRHFPDEVQGDILINNTIGFLGTKEHVLEDDGSGYKSHHRQDLLQSSDMNFRPVDLEFAPDGSLYLIDWHNVLIGHMQHNQRDPMRDHTHGRIYRVTYPSRPLLQPAKIAGEPIDALLENLKLPEYRTRYRTRRELRDRKTEAVLDHVKTWITRLNKQDPNYEHQLLEALWVTAGTGKVDQQLLQQVLKAKDYHARAAAVRILRNEGDHIANQAKLLQEMASDSHPRVRLEAIVAASWLPKESGLPIINASAKMPLDDWMKPAYNWTLALLKGEPVPSVSRNEANIPKNINKETYLTGKAIYMREGMCVTCHQENGKGLEISGFPPLTPNPWIAGDEERLIKLVLKGLQGPLEVNGKKYPGQVPMMAFGRMLKDDEIAAVLTYVRNSFGNKSSAITTEKVQTVRKAINGKESFYTAQELLKEHPLKK